MLHVLAGATKPRTGREIARLADRSQSATQRVLDRLVEHGLVLQEEAGRSRIYTLNREHLAAEPISELVHLRLRLFRRIALAVGEWRRSPFHVSVFGSAARGDGSAQSDIDVFVVRPADVDEDDELWRRQLDSLATSIHVWSGNHAGIAEVGEDELGALRRERPPVVAELERDAVQIFGGHARRLLKEG